MTTVSDGVEMLNISIGPPGEPPYTGVQESLDTRFSTWVRKRRD